MGAVRVASAVPDVPAALVALAVREDQVVSEGSVELAALVVPVELVEPAVLESLEV